MIDLNTFRKQFCEGLIRVAAELDQKPLYEAERQYLTDAVFHAQVDTVVEVAVVVIQRMEQEPGEDRMPELRDIFHNEADDAWAAWED